MAAELPPDTSCSLDSLMVELQSEVHAIASRQMARERANHTLQPTALVNEVYLRLVEQGNLKEVGRARFLAAAAVTIRRVLADHARRRDAEKRGGGRERVTISEVEPAAADGQLDVLALDEVLDKLASKNRRICDVVVCRYFSGMTVAEIAEALGVSERTVAGDWAFAKAWLRHELSL